MIRIAMRIQEFLNGIFLTLRGRAILRILLITLEVVGELLQIFGRWDIWLAK